MKEQILYTDRLADALLRVKVRESQDVDVSLLGEYGKFENR